MATISHKYKCIFFHVPKTGGTSIKGIFRREGDCESLDKQKLSLDQAIKNNVSKELIWQPMTHFKVKELKKIIPEEIFNNYFKFAFVRNPWDLAVSRYLHKMTKSPIDGLYRRMNIHPSFREWVKHDVKSASVHQKNFISDDDGKVLVDFIGRFENLEQDFKKISERIKSERDKKLPRANRTEHEHYSFYYDDETKKMIEREYEEDIKFFGYKFENKKKNDDELIELDTKKLFFQHLKSKFIK